MTTQETLMTSSVSVDDVDGINVTNGTGFFDRNEMLAKAEVVVLSTILYMALFGNGIVLLVLKLRYQKLSRMQWFIAHLAIADLFVAFFQVLPQLIWDLTVEFHGNDAVCRLIKLFQVVAMCASSFVLVMTAIDRYMSICHPLTTQTLSPSRVHQMIALAWTLSLLFSLPQLFIFSLQEMDDGKYQCYADFEPAWGLKAYVTYTFLVIYVIPCLMLVFLYGRICLKVWASVAFKESSSSLRQAKLDRNTSYTSQKSFRLRVSFKRMNNTNNSSTRSYESGGSNQQSTRMLTPPRKKYSSGRWQGVSTAKVKTVKMTLTVVLTYLICWAPYFFSNVLNVFGDIEFESTSNTIIMLLASLNSCTNPWIYLAFGGSPCPRNRQDRRVSRSYNTSTHIYTADSTLETSTALNPAVLNVPTLSNSDEEHKQQSVLLKNGTSSQH